MFTFETVDPKEARRFRIAQFNGRAATFRSDESTVTGMVRSIVENRASDPSAWVVTLVPTPTSTETQRTPPRSDTPAEKRC